MTLDVSTVLAIRFGYGLPQGEGLRDPLDLLEQLKDPDQGLQIAPAVGLQDQLRAFQTYKKAQKREKQRKAGATEELERLKKQWRAMRRKDIEATFLRPLLNPQSFRERLVAFWENHFTISTRTIRDQIIGLSFRDTAIRPNISGRFEEVLRALILHPSMLFYLNQDSSFGPNSRIGKKRGKGLNENFAREFLELHTIGRDGLYSQHDVRQLAELFTGLRVGKTGVGFNGRRAEPGTHTVLGVEYGVGRTEDMRYIFDFIRDIAAHPATARHIATRLVTHFIGDDQTDAIETVAKAYQTHDGDLMQVYRALLSHPAATMALGAKVKWPKEFMISSLRALGVGRDQIEGLSNKDSRLLLDNALITMGQPHRRAPSPEGWSENASDWITPQGLAARVQWAMIMAHRFGVAIDPREFVETTLSERASDTVRWTVERAASQPEALGLVLASPEFNRR